MLRKYIPLIILLLASTLAGQKLDAQQPERKSYRFRGGRYSGYTIEQGDTVINATINPLYVYPRPSDMRKYQRLVNNVKKVYPYAVEARQYMYKLETGLAGISSSRQREKFVAAMEKEIVRKYTPILEKMTFTQGKILIKLIDRETQRSPYQILRQFRGRFTAGFYNTIAKLFKADLNQRYDPSQGEDAMIERIITLIEAGLL